MPDDSRPAIDDSRSGVDDSRPGIDDGSDRDPPETGSVTFSVAGARDGFVACLPIALGVASYGVAFGVLATQAGLSVAEATLMSATVLAGAAQLIAVELWADSVPAAAIVLTTLLVNLRYVVMGAALRPWFSDLSARAAYGSAFFTADENWALTMSELTDGDGRGAYLLGSGLAIWVCWVAATVLGAAAGDGLGDPARYGLDFVFVAVFAAIAADLWEGAATGRQWAAAAVAAAASAHVLPGRWYVLLGAGAGCLVGVAPLAEPADSGSDRAERVDRAERSESTDPEAARE